MYNLRDEFRADEEIVVPRFYIRLVSDLQVKPYKRFIEELNKIY